MIYEIKNRFTGEVIFSADRESFSLCVQFAVSSGADLTRADLYGANLYGANLYGANLYGANLYGEKITKCPIQIAAGMRWYICITEKHIQIGCQVHLAEKWFKFTDDEVSKMHLEALPWWKENKAVIEGLWKLHIKEAWK